MTLTCIPINIAARGPLVALAGNASLGTPQMQPEVACGFEAVTHGSGNARGSLIPQGNEAQQATE